MDDLIFTLLLLLIPILSIGIPIGLSYLIYFVLTKKKVNKLLRILALTPVFIMIYFLYYAIYPDNDFYRTYFKTVTGIDFPKSAKIIEKTASFPDHFGDYTSVFVIKVKTDFYDNLQLKLEQNKFEKGDGNWHNPKVDNFIKSLEKQTIIKDYFQNDASIYYYIAFLSDKQSIIIKRTSW